MKGRAPARTAVYGGSSLPRATIVSNVSITANPPYNDVSEALGS
jgi:hypothetical protein